MLQLGSVENGACETTRYAPNPDVAPRLFLNTAVKTLNSIHTEDEYESRAKDLHTRFVLVALNFAERSPQVQEATSGLAFHSFHEETTTTSDHRLRDACLGTPLWGSYITDLVKFVDGVLSPVRDSKASNIERRLRVPEFLGEQVDGLCYELSRLGCENPTIVALGNAVYSALTSNREIQALVKLQQVLGDGTRINKVPHYSKAAAMSHHDYVARVYRALRGFSIM